MEHMKLTYMVHWSTSVSIIYSDGQHVQSLMTSIKKPLGNEGETFCM